MKKEEVNGLPFEELLEKGHRGCAGCGQALAARHAIKAAGKNTIVCNATGCLEVFTTPYPETSWKVPWVHAAFENAAAVASGVERAMKKSKKSYNLLILGGDGSTFDIGFQALSGAIERGHNFCYICFDNGAYMNTGIQRSGATPKYTDTTTSPAGKKIHGKTEFKKPMPLIIAAHGAYVATANIAFPQDFVAKVRKGLAHKGPAYIQVFSPCPLGWKHHSSLSIEVAKQAYKTKVTPLFEIENGILTFTKKPSEDKPISDYLKTQGRFKHMNPKEIADAQQHTDSEWKKLIDLESSKVRIF